MVQKLTDTMVSIEGEDMRPFYMGVIDEVKSGNWGIGGKDMTTEAVKAIAEGKSCMLNTVRRLLFGRLPWCLDKTIQ